MRAMFIPSLFLFIPSLFHRPNKSGGNEDVRLDQPDNIFRGLIEKFQKSLNNPHQNIFDQRRLGQISLFFFMLILSGGPQWGAFVTTQKEQICCHIFCEWRGAFGPFRRGPSAPPERKTLFWVEEGRRPHPENNISRPLRGLQK
jgi:hypothetical protein